jgi:hypothetical protein
MLQTCVIETRLGALYRFPDFEGPLEIPKGAGLSKALTQLTIVNISGSCLVLPWRIIKTIKLDEEVVWTGPEV